MKIDKSILLFSLAATLTTGPTEAASKHFDFARIVIVGDSLLAGFRDGGLAAPYQETSIAALIANQIETPLTQPLIAWPGIPNVLELVDAGPPPVLQPAAGVSAGRVDILTQASNLAVPGHGVREALNARPDFPIDSLTDLVLGLPGLLGGVSKSQVEWAEALQPTTVICWLGANDTLGAAQDGTPASVTPYDEFTAAYSEIVQRLTATGARVVVANIPDVTVIPYLTSFELLEVYTGVPAPILTAVLGVGPGDYLNPTGVGLAIQILLQNIAGPLPDHGVLSAGEIASVQAATAQFNSFIASTAKAQNAVLVDMHSLLNRWHTHGAVFHGERLTTDYLGGIFSLDGFHATFEGSLLAANEFIRVLNQNGARIPRITPATVRKDY